MRLTIFLLLFFKVHLGNVTNSPSSAGQPCYANVSEVTANAGLSISTTELNGQSEIPYKDGSNVRFLVTFSYPSLVINKNVCKGDVSQLWRNENKKYLVLFLLFYKIVFSSDIFYWNPEVENLYCDYSYFLDFLQAGFSLGVRWKYCMDRLCQIMMFN